MSRAYLRKARSELVAFASPLDAALAAAYRAFVLHRLGYTVADVCIARQHCHLWHAVCHVDPDQDLILRTDDFCYGQVEGCDVLDVYLRAIELVGRGVFYQVVCGGNDDDAQRIADGLQCFGLSGAPFVLEAAVMVVKRITCDGEEDIYAVADAVVKGESVLAVLAEVPASDPLDWLVEAVHQGVADDDR